MGGNRSNGAIWAMRSIGTMGVMGAMGGIGAMRTIESVEEIGAMGAIRAIRTIGAIGLHCGVARVFNTNSQGTLAHSSNVLGHCRTLESLSWLLNALVTLYPNKIYHAPLDE